MTKLQVLQKLTFALCIFFLGLIPFSSFANKSSLASEENKEKIEKAAVNRPDRLFAFGGPHTASTQGATNFAGGTTTLTLPLFTVPAGNDRLLIVKVHHDATTINTVTFAGMNMSQRIAAQRIGGGGRTINTAIYSLTLGSGTAQTGLIEIQGTSATNTIIVGAATAFDGIDQANPIGATLAMSGNSNSAMSSIATIAGNIIIDAISIDHDVEIMAGSNQTSIYNFVDDSNGRDIRVASSTKTATGTSTSVSWNFNFADDYAHAIAVLKCTPIIPTTPPATLTATDNKDYGLNAIDPCDCNDPLNQRLGNITLFHDLLTVTTITGSSISIAANDGEFRDINNVPYPVGTPIPETSTPGTYQLPFYHQENIATTISYTDGITTNTFVSSTCTTCFAIPTLSQWGVLIFGLLLLNLGLLFLLKMEKQTNNR